jgi:hypothetical protein
VLEPADAARLVGPGKVPENNAGAVTLFEADGEVSPDRLHSARVVEAAVRGPHADDPIPDRRRHQTRTHADPVGAEPLAARVAGRHPNDDEANALAGSGHSDVAPPPGHEPLDALPMPARVDVGRPAHAEAEQVAMITQGPKVPYEVAHRRVAGS